MGQVNELVCIYQYASILSFPRRHWTGKCLSTRRSAYRHSKLFKSYIYQCIISLYIHTIPFFRFYLVHCTYIIVHTA